MQDYWREEEDKLIPFGKDKNGKLRQWTRFHLPPHDRNGNITYKGENPLCNWKDHPWGTWYKDLLAKLTDATSYELLKPDTRAQWKGICFPDGFDLSCEPPELETDDDLQKRAQHINIQWALFWSNTDFIYANFGEYTDFDCSLFREQVDFSGTIFSNGARFTSVIFIGWVNYEATVFQGVANFENSLFADGAIFRGTRFMGHAFFRNAAFLKSTHFKYSRFYGTTDFDNVICSDQLNFRHAEFYEPITFFSQSSTTEQKATTNSAFDFFKASFHSNVNFTDRFFGVGSSFSNTAFFGIADFYGCELHPSVLFDDTSFALPRLNLNTLDKFWIKRYGVKSDILEKQLGIFSKEAARYQSAFQALCLHMERLRNHGQELKFSKLEMQARERRIGSKDVPWWVRYLSKGYGLFADYGQSAWRPFLWLIGFYLLAAGLYSFLAGDWASPGDAFSVAFQYSLPPVSTFAAQFFAGEVDQNFINALLDHPFLTRLVMVTHGVTSLALVFFLLLALKRRFQIR